MLDFVLFSIPLVTGMFYFTRFALDLRRAIAVYAIRFPHSEISGSQVATHLPEAYRCYAASFIAFSSLGIHHSPLIPILADCANHPNADLMQALAAPAKLCSSREIGPHDNAIVGLHDLDE